MGGSWLAAARGTQEHSCAPCASMPLAQCWVSWQCVALHWPKLSLLPSADLGLCLQGARGEPGERGSAGFPGARGPGGQKVRSWAPCTTVGSPHCPEALTHIFAVAFTREKLVCQGSLVSR